MHENAFLFRFIYEGGVMRVNLSNGDSSFIKEVVEKFSDMVLRIAYQNLKNYCDAEDVVQDVFIKLMKEDNFQDENHIKAWLIKVTINRCKDINKSSWYKKTEPFTKEIEEFTDEEKNVLEEVMNLPKDYRNVVYLFYYEGYKISEIAKILDKKDNTISSQLTRARKKLKINLLKGGYEYERGRL